MNFFTTGGLLLQSGFSMTFAISNASDFVTGFRFTCNGYVKISLEMFGVC